MSTKKITELRQTTNRVDKTVIDRMNAAAEKMSKIAEEIKKDADAIKSGKIPNYENN